MKKIFFFTIVAISICACAAPELTKRFKSAEWVANQDGLVDVEAFSIERPGQTTTATLLSLSERGQAEFINTIGAKTTTTKELLDTLGSSIGKKPAPGLFLNNTEFKRRLVLSTRRVPATNDFPGNRIHSLSCTLSGLSGDLSFKSWELFSTKYENVDLGKITLDQSTEGSLNVNATSAEGSGDPVARGGSFSVSRNMNEEVSLRQRYIVLSGVLGEKQAVVSQEGVVGIDLAGNSFIDLTMQMDEDPPVPVFSIGPYKAGNNWLPQNQVIAVKRFVTYPRSSVDQTADLNCDYVLRNVSDIESRSTVIEGDDNVQFLSGTLAASKNVVLLPAEILDFKLWFF